MEPDQIDILAPAVLCNLEKIDEAEETGLSRQLRSDIREADRLNGIHFDFTFFHRVPVPGFDMRVCPESDAAGDFSAPNAVAKTLGEDHEDEFTRAVVLLAAASDCHGVRAASAGHFFCDVDDQAAAGFKRIADVAEHSAVAGPPHHRRGR
ncbi:MAG TPA: hypothetical protein VEU96_09990 [Bryobacteraceae bacterium]|nr:hypothetical protein [Bryobacteraceae bacterium]